MPYESWIEKSFREKGRADERRNLLEAAKRLLAENISLSKVAEFMQLTPEEVQLITAAQN
ncbi:MAG: hypothetical protein IJS28_01235 [Synergistaceae bacterium]|nr:hypothetical protein [Synergistaceae bacterium]